MSWSEDFEYFGSDGTVIAAHSGIAHRMSECKLTITGYNVQTWYSHIVITVDDSQLVLQGDAIGFIDTRRAEANCGCDVVYCKFLFCC